MADQRVTIRKIVDAYGDYVALAEALGFEVKKGNVRRGALADLDYRGDMKSFFSRSYAERYPDRTAPVEVLEAVAALRDDLMDVAKKGLNGQLPEKAKADAGQVAEALEKLADAERDTIAAAVNGKHADFLKPGEVPVERFHEALDAYTGDQTIARSKLVKHLRKALTERGIKMSGASIEERLRRNTKVRSVPPALIELIHNLDGSFRSGLVPIETMSVGKDPTEWLDRTLETLGFRSKNSLHKAVAEETGVNYETVHKALTNPDKGQRIRIEIRDCLHDWLKRVAAGETLPAAAESTTAPRRNKRKRGSSIKKVLNKLEDAFGGAEKMYAEAARALSTDVDTVRRLHEDGAGASVSPENITALKRLLKTRKEDRHNTSYLRDRQSRRHAEKMAERVTAAREAWMDDPDNTQLYERFRRLRLQLIIAVKEGHGPHRNDAGSEPIESIYEAEYLDVA